MALSSNCTVWAAEAEWSALAKGAAIACEEASAGELVDLTDSPEVPARLQLESCLGLLICLCVPPTPVRTVAGGVFRT